MHLLPLEPADYALLDAARQAIARNYDSKDFLHTVGAAVRCRNQHIYTGINVYSLHGACAEQIALGTAMTQGEREFECIVAVRGAQGEEVLPPCGNCRQILSDYMPDCMVIVPAGPDSLAKVRARELLPCAYGVTAD